MEKAVVVPKGMFTNVGVSSVNGILTLRVCNGSIATREKILKQNGHTEIQFLAMPKAMTKEDAFTWLRKRQTNGAIAKLADRAASPSSRLYRALPAEQRTDGNRVRYQHNNGAKKVTFEEFTKAAKAAGVVIPTNKEALAKMEAKFNAQQAGEREVSELQRIEQRRKELLAKGVKLPTETKAAPKAKTTPKKAGDEGRNKSQTHAAPNTLQMATPTS